MFRTILVPLDGSLFGEHAIPMALSLATRAGASVRLLHVLQPFVEVVPELTAYQGPIEAEYRQEKQKYLDGIVGRIREVSKVPVSAELLEGEIAATIRAASEGKAELIVMTTHGRGPLARFWLGSVADELLRSSTVPLLLLHPSKAAPDFKAEILFKHILLPLDGTPLAEQIVPVAAEVARIMGASCTLLRVTHTDVPESLASSSRGVMVTERVRMMVEELETLEKRKHQEAESYLEGIAERIRPLGVHVQTSVILDEPPAPAILNAAENGMDLIALETHGRGGLKRLWLGSVADKVIRGSSVPVLVQRPRH
jgi:nucleotide-binding universal stress UspA family protein